MTSAAKRNWTAALYWIGVAMTLACFAFILAGNTESVWRFEHKAFPLSWAFAGAAVLAFLATELSQSVSSARSNLEDPSSQLSPELASAESES